MAQKVQVILVDDVDGGQADETVQFALDGVSYEIDVTGDKAEQIREALGPWVDHARRVGGRYSTVARSAAKKKESKPRENLEEVRVWARENGYVVSARGRLSGVVTAAWENRGATPEPEVQVAPTPRRRTNKKAEAAFSG